MDTDEAGLRQRLAEVDERIDRVGKRFTAGYGSDADRDAWLAWLRQLEASRAALLVALDEHGAAPGAGERGPMAPDREAPGGGER